MQSVHIVFERGCLFERRPLLELRKLRNSVLLPQPTAGAGCDAWGIEALSVSHKATTCGWCGLQIRASRRWWLCGCRAESPTRVFRGARPHLFIISGFGFWVSGFGFRVLGFGFWVLSFGFRVSGFGFWLLASGFWVLGFGFWVLGLGKWLREWLVVEICIYFPAETISFKKFYYLCQCFD